MSKSRLTSAWRRARRALALASNLVVFGLLGAWLAPEADGYLISIGTIGAIVGILGGLTSIGGSFGLFGGGDEGGTLAPNEAEALAKAQAEGQMKALQELFFGPQFAGDILQGLEPFLGDILDFLTRPVKLTQSEKDEPRLFRELRPKAEDAARRIEGLFPFLEDFVATGRPTDITPIADAEINRLLTETAPSLAENFAGLLGSSGFENALARAGGDVGFNLGAIQAQLDEAATGRALEALGIAPGIFEAPSNLLAGFAEALGSSGQRFRERKESARPGGRILQFLPALLAGETAQGFVAPGFGPGAGTSDVLSSLFGSQISPQALSSGLDLLSGGLGQLGQLWTTNRVNSDVDALLASNPGGIFSSSAGAAATPGNPAGDLPSYNPAFF